MLDPFDWYTVIALGIAVAISGIVLIGAGLPWRRSNVNRNFPDRL